MARKYHAYKNENPLKKETSDCVVRALATATGESWDTVYKELFEIGFELKVMPNDNEAWREYLTRKGFTKHSISVKKGSKRPTVLGFAKANKEGTHILQVANHITVCKEGVYYDLWDCGECCLYSYWSK